jgi:hypothetical protein
MPFRPQRAVWATDFSQFLIEIVRASRFDKDAGYVHPSRCEESLARYFFHSKSPKKQLIDLILNRMRDRLPIELVPFCYELIPPGLHLTASEQSVALDAVVSRVVQSVL